MQKNLPVLAILVASVISLSLTAYLLWKPSFFPGVPTSQNLIQAPSDEAVAPTNGFSQYLKVSPATAIKLKDFTVQEAFSQTSLNNTLWTTSIVPPSPQAQILVKDGKLTAVSASTGDSSMGYPFSGIASTTLVRGDFRMESSIDNFVPATTGAGSAELQIIYTKFSDDCHNCGLYLAWVKQKGSQYLLLTSIAAKGVITKSDSLAIGTPAAARIRMDRIGNSAYIYLNSETGFKLLQEVKNVYTGPGFIRLGTVIWERSLPTLRAGFDDFTFVGKTAENFP